MISRSISISIYIYIIYSIYYNLSRSNEPPPVVPKRKSSPEGERLGGSEHQPSFILFIEGMVTTVLHMYVSIEPWMQFFSIVCLARYLHK